MAIILILFSEQLLRNFLGKVQQLQELFKNFEATFKKIWSNFWLRLATGLLAFSK